MSAPCPLRRGLALLAALALGAPELARADPARSASSLDIAARVVADELERVPAERRRYDWDVALLLHALVTVAPRSPDGARYLAYVRRFFEAWADRMPEVTSPDLAAPALAAAELELRFGLRSGDAAVRSTLAFLRAEPRNPLGALDHVGRRHRFRAWLPLTRRFTRRAIWVDSLAMYAVTGAALARLDGDRDLEEFCYQQPLIFARVLQADNGLFKHAYLLKPRRLLPRGDVFWLRGHAWALFGMVELLEQMPADHPLRPELERRFRRAAAGIMAFRSGADLWDTLLTRRGRHNYPETSGSVLVAYVLARGHRLGLLDASFREAAAKTFEAAIARVRRKRGARLHLRGVSGPTNAAGAAFVYTSPLVTRNSSAPYGVAALLLLASEIERGDDSGIRRAPREFSLE